MNNQAASTPWLRHTGQAIALLTVCVLIDAAYLVFYGNVGSSWRLPLGLAAGVLTVVSLGLTLFAYGRLRSALAGQSVLIDDLKRAEGRSSRAVLEASAPSRSDNADAADRQPEAFSLAGDIELEAVAAETSDTSDDEEVSSSAFALKPAEEHAAADESAPAEEPSEPQRPEEPEVVVDMTEEPGQTPVSADDVQPIAGVDGDNRSAETDYDRPIPQVTPPNNRRRSHRPFPAGDRGAISISREEAEAELNLDVSLLEESGDEAGRADLLLDALRERFEGLHEKWALACQRRDIITCREIIAAISKIAEPDLVHELEEDLARVDRGFREELRSQFVQRLRAGDWHEALRVGQEITALFPRSAMAQDFVRLRDRLKWRAEGDVSPHGGPASESYEAPVPQTVTPNDVARPPT